MNAINFAFLHGGGQGSWVWRETMDALRAQAADAIGGMVALDIPGCGAKRGRPTEHLDPQSVARELIGDLESSRMRDVVLVGHSLAGNVLPALAELRPDLFRHLIYVSCSIPLPGQTVMQLVGTGLHGSSEHEVGWPIDPRTTSMSERYQMMFCNDMSATQRTEFLGRLGRDDWPSSYFKNTSFAFNFDAVRSSYVICLQDRILPVAWQEKFAARFHARQLVRIDAGHQAMNTRPHTLAEVLRHSVVVDR